MSDLGPLDREPRSTPPCPSRDDREAWIREALAGVELGAYDERMIAWLAGSDVATVGTVVSWLHRVRQAGRDDNTPEE